MIQKREWIQGEAGECYHGLFSLPQPPSLIITTFTSQKAQLFLNCISSHLHHLFDTTLLQCFFSHGLLEQPQPASPASGLYNQHEDPIHWSDLAQNPSLAPTGSLLPPAKAPAPDGPCSGCLALHTSPALPPAHFLPLTQQLSFPHQDLVSHLHPLAHVLPQLMLPFPSPPGQCLTF